MADQKISELTALTGANVADDDAIAIVDTSATETKKIVFSELKNALDTATGFVRITGDTMTGALDVQSTITADGLTVDVLSGELNIGSDANARAELSYNYSQGDFTLENTWANDAGEIFIRAGGQLRQQISGNGDISFYEDTGTTPKFFWDASAESLGIGTSSPSYSLTTLSGTANTAIAQFTGTDVGRGLRIETASTTRSDDTAILNASDAFGELAFETNSTERLRITSAGNVGIGTSSPATKVDINNSTSDSLLTLTTNSFGGAARTGVNFQVNGFANTPSGQIAVVGDNNYSGNMVFSVASSGTTNPLTERMRIDSSGSLIINRTSKISSEKLSVKGEIRAGYTASDNQVYLGVDSSNAYLGTNASGFGLKFEAGGSEAMRIDSSGNVGIGTSSIYSTAVNRSALSVNGVTDAIISLGNGTTENGFLYANTSNTITGTRTATPYIFYTNNTERMRIDSSGNVDLYADKNLSWLWQPNDYIRGQITVTSANNMTFTTAYGERMRITSAGNVGIGTSSPASNHRATIVGTGGDRSQPLEIIGTGTAAGFSWLIGARQENLGTGQRAAIFVGKAESTYNMGAMYHYHVADGSASNELRWGLFGADDLLKLSTAGNLTVTGALSKGSGSFRIDHPIASKSATHDLVHSFVEAPQADNMYRGKVDLVAGQATVNIDTVAGMTDGTFALLNREIQCFTSNETGWTAVRGSVSGNILTIEAQDNTCTDTISWMVIGERQDQHMYDTNWTDENGKVIVEPEKTFDVPQED